MDWETFQRGLEQFGAEKYQQAKSFLTLPGRAYRGEPISLEEITAFALGTMGGGIPGGGRGMSVAGTTVMPAKVKFPFSLRKRQYRQLTKELDTSRAQIELWEKRTKHPLRESILKTEKKYRDDLIQQKYNILKEWL